MLFILAENICKQDYMHFRHTQHYITDHLRTYFTVEPAN